MGKLREGDDRILPEKQRGGFDSVVTTTFAQDDNGKSGLVFADPSRGWMGHPSYVDAGTGRRAWWLREEG